MNNYLSSIYGQLMGFDRIQIRRMAGDSCRMSANELASLSLKLFQRRVHNALRDYPFYYEKVLAYRRKVPDGGEFVNPTGLPVWTRDDQRKLTANLRTPPCFQSYLHSTGGSTGVPLHFYISRVSYEWRMAVSDRGYSWAGAEAGRKSYYVWGAPIERPALGSRVKACLNRVLRRRRYFDSFKFDDSRKDQCCREIDRYRPSAIVGYSGNLVELARFVRENSNALKWRSRTVVSAAEGLVPGQRELIEEFLGRELFMSYGSREFMLIGMECSQHNGYHLSSDNLYVEVVDDHGKPVRDGESGRILVTDLRNDANPFVRYEIGDIGTYTSRKCSCGSPFPLIESVDGRIQEVVVKPDGSKMTALFLPHLMKEFDWVEGYQVHQAVMGSIMINIITDSEMTGQALEPIRQALVGKLGDNMVVEFKKVEALKRNSSGKTPIVISSL